MRNPEIRIGFGYDAHPFKKGRALWLGGVRIPFPKGLGGHSDADVILHAMMDALLGAAGLGDIGQHFPPRDPRFKGIASLKLLKRVKRLLDQQHWQVVNVDSTLLAEEPKISPYISRMIEAITDALGLPHGRVQAKATTNERMGFIGRKQGAAACAVALIQRK